MPTAPETDVLDVHDWVELPRRLSAQVAQLAAALDSSLETQRGFAQELDVHEERQANTLRLSRRLEQKLDALDSKIESLTALSDEHFAQAVLDPIAKRVFPVLDVIEQVRQDDPNPPSLLKGIRASLLELLSHLGVTPVRSSIGTPLEARSQHPIRLIATTDAALDGKVAQSLRLGFRREDAWVRPESVAIYRHSPSRALVEGEPSS